MSEQHIDLVPPFPTQPMAGSMTVIVISDRAVVSHLAVAVVEYRRALKRQRVTEPAALAQLEEMLCSGSHRVTEGRSLSETRPMPHDPTMAILLTISEVAARLNVGTSTVKSLTRDGSLPTVHIGSAVRVHEADLYEFTDALREERRLQTKDASS